MSWFLVTSPYRLDKYELWLEVWNSWIYSKERCSRRGHPSCPRSFGRKSLHFFIIHHSKNDSNTFISPRGRRSWIRGRVMSCSGSDLQHNEPRRKKRSLHDHHLRPASVFSVVSTCVDKHWGLVNLWRAAARNSLWNSLNNRRSGCEYSTAFPSWQRRAHTTLFLWVMHRNPFRSELVWRHCSASGKIFVQSCWREARGAAWEEQIIAQSIPDLFTGELQCGSVNRGLTVFRVWWRHWSTMPSRLSGQVQEVAGQAWFESTQTESGKQPIWAQGQRLDTRRPENVQVLLELRRQAPDGVGDCARSHGLGTVIRRQTDRSWCARQEGRKGHWFLSVPTVEVMWSPGLSWTAVFCWWMPNALPWVSPRWGSWRWWCGAASGLTTKGKNLSWICGSQNSGTSRCVCHGGEGQMVFWDRVVPGSIREGKVKSGTKIAPQTGRTGVAMRWGVVLSCAAGKAVHFLVGFEIAHGAYATRLKVTIATRSWHYELACCSGVCDVESGVSWLFSTFVAKENKNNKKHRIFSKHSNMWSNFQNISNKNSIIYQKMTNKQHKKNRKKTSKHVLQDVRSCDIWFFSFTSVLSTHLKWVNRISMSNPCTSPLRSKWHEAWKNLSGRCQHFATQDKTFALWRSL